MPEADLEEKPSWSQTGMMKLLILIGFGLGFPAYADRSTECPTTVIEASQIEAPGFKTPNDYGYVWYGSDKLAVWINGDGNYCSECGKLWWWREGEWEQDRLHVTASRVDNANITATSWWTSNATFSDGRAMLNPIAFPSAGCWEVSATYYDDASLTFTTYVSEPSEHTYGRSSAYVANVENLDQLFDHLTTGLRMTDYFGYVWERPQNWRSFEDALTQMPLPETFEVRGFTKLKNRMPLEAETLAALLKQAAARVDNATVEFM